MYFLFYFYNYLFYKNVVLLDASYMHIKMFVSHLSWQRKWKKKAQKAVQVLSAMEHMMKNLLKKLPGTLPRKVRRFTEIIYE